MFFSLSLLDFLVVSLLWAHVIGLVMIYVAYKLQFSMGILRLFASLFQWRSCISRAWFSFPRDRIVSCPRGGFLSIIYFWVEFFVSSCFVILVGVLAAILHISRYGVGSHVGMHLRVAFWLFYVALFFALFV